MAPADATVESCLEAVQELLALAEPPKDTSKTGYEIPGTTAFRLSKSQKTVAKDAIIAWLTSVTLVLQNFEKTLSAQHLTNIHQWFKVHKETVEARITGRTALYSDVLMHGIVCSFHGLPSEPSPLSSNTPSFFPRSSCPSMPEHS